MKLAAITQRLSGLGSDKWAVHIEGKRRAAAGENLIFLSIGEPDAPPWEPPSSDPLRYGAARAAGLPSGEMAFLKVRWKAPGATSSQLIQQAIPAGNTARDLASAPEATRWAVAVAAFGQKLRGDPWLADSYGWDQILDTAQKARGEDEFGLRAEFVKLVRAAKEGRSQNG